MLQHDDGKIVSALNATHNRAIRRDVKRDNVMMRKSRFNVKRLYIPHDGLTRPTLGGFSELYPKGTCDSVNAFVFIGASYGSNACCRFTRDH